MSSPALVEPATSFEVELARAVAECYADPLRFVRTMYRWPINGEPGPDQWQEDFLNRIGEQVRERRFDGITPVAPIRGGVSSGHGIGKGALTAWIVDWIMSTRCDAQGTITANTNEQLERKTWAAIRSWTEKCLTGHWFEINSAIMYRKGSRADWFCAPQSCAEEKSEAFAGQHAKSSTSFYINDEDSAVPEKIHEVEEGGLTDGEPMIFLFGNPTRNTGAFHTAAFGKGRDRWGIRVIDARTCKLPNKKQIAEWLEDYGEESDFFRVRVRGLPPLSNDLQFIDSDRIHGAQRREALSLPDDPLIAGMDVSGGGSAWTVVRFRRGKDARSRPPLRFSGAQTLDRQSIISAMAELLRDEHPDRKVHALFIDSAYGSPIAERLKSLGFEDRVHEINFGGFSPNVHQANMRAYMWNKCKEWLPTGAIPKDDARLETDLAAPGHHLNPKDQLVLESKESMAARNVASPDDGDAHCLTFAAPVAPTSPQQEQGYSEPMIQDGWMR